MECAYYFGILGGRHMECAYYFDFCRLYLGGRALFPDVQVDKEIGYRRCKTLNRISPVDGFPFAYNPDIRGRSVDCDGTVLAIDHPNYLHTTMKVLQTFSCHFSFGVTRAEDFDNQIGN